MLLKEIIQGLTGNPASGRIYLDYAGATPLRPECIDEMNQVQQYWANPGALHQEGVQAKRVLDDARSRIARVLAVKPAEILFTSGATEANNLALFGVAHAIAQGEPKKRIHIVSTTIEHSSVLEVLTSKAMQAIADVSFIAPNAHGEITATALQNALTKHTRMVSIGWANGEIGTIQSLRALGAVLREYEKEKSIKIVFHSDAGQSAFAVTPQPHGVHLDMLTLSSGKLYGPRGVAVLFVKNETPLMSMLFGGGQERGYRPGTEDPYLAIGCARALECLEDERPDDFKKQRELRSFFLRELHSMFPDGIINGTGKHQLPHIVNISIPEIDSEYIMLALDHKGIACTTKSICLLQEGNPESPVVKALGGEPWRSTTTLRFSFGRGTTKLQIVHALTILQDVVEAYRRM